MLKKRLLLRLRVRNPPKKVRFVVQDAQAATMEAITHSDDVITFEIPVKVADAGAMPPRLTGSYTHGRPGARYVHLWADSETDLSGNQWIRRAKVPLGGISQELIGLAATLPNTVLATEIAGTSDDGGPCCSTVVLLVPWHLEDRGPRRGVLESPTVRQATECIES